MEAFKKLRTRTRERIYILPTGFGVLFILGAVVMILIGSAYQNNLVNMLAFFMLSLVFICMIQTHNNMKDIAVDGVETEGGFEGEMFLTTAALATPSATERFSLEARLPGLKLANSYVNNMSLRAGRALKLKSTYPAQKRGRHPLTKLRISSAYPLGLFRAWRVLPIESSYFVYPAPRGDAVWPEPAAPQGEREARTAPAAGGDDFQGHRKFRAGDSHHHLDWKAHARGRPGLIKEFNEGARQELIFSWHQLPGLEAEARLSQLSRWVCDAHARGLIYALELPDARVPAGEGLAHATRCWEQLALVKHAGERSA